MGGVKQLAHAEGEALIEILAVLLLANAIVRFAVAMGERSSGCQSSRL